MGLYIYALNEIEKIENMYIQRQKDADIERALTALATKLVESGNFEGDAFGYLSKMNKAHWKEDEHLVHWTSAKNPYPEISRLLIHDVVSNKLYTYLKMGFVTPMDGVDKTRPLEALPDQVLQSERLKQEVANTGCPGKSPEQVKKLATIMVCLYEEKAQKGFVHNLKKMCSFMGSKKSKDKAKKAHQDALNMYGYDEYGYAERLELNTYDVDVHPYEYQVQPQPAMIAGYDTSHAMSMDVSLAIAMLFGLVLLSLVLYLFFAIAFSVAVAFGFYASANSKQGNENDDDLV